MRLTAKIIKANTNKEKSKSRIVLEVDENIIPSLERQNPKYAEIKIDDGRTITAEQRKKAYATIGDIADYTGDLPEYLKEHFKFRLMAEQGIDYFSLSDCSVSIARDYISLILDTAIEYGFPLRDLAINRTDDIDRFIYKCLATRTCVITGQKGADIHHVLGSRVGMGRNRTKISHSNLKIIPLSREWHTRVHAEGEEEIFKKYKIYGLKVDKQTLKNLGLNHKDID